MITLKLHETKEILNGCEAIAKQKIKPTLSYKISKTIKTLVEEAKEFERLRIEVCEKYAEKDDNGQSVKNDNGYVIADFEGFKAEYDELVNQDTEVDIKLLSVSELENNGVTLSAEDMFALDKILTD